VAALLLLSYRPVKTPDGLDIITNIETYNTSLKQAEALSKTSFEASDRGQDLTPAQNADLLKAAKIFDAMNVFLPAKVGPYLGAGKAYMILGDNERADERLRQCMSNAQYDQSDAGKATVIEAEYLLSLVRGLENDWKTAYDLANDAAKSVPNSAYYLAARASANLQLKRVKEAKADLAKALMIDPTNRKALQLQLLISSVKG
jgi:tetratricopeptide (TPR) repeat protein